MKETKNAFMKETMKELMVQTRNEVGELRRDLGRTRKEQIKDLGMEWEGIDEWIYGRN